MKSYSEYTIKAEVSTILYLSTGLHIEEETVKITELLNP